MTQSPNGPVLIFDSGIGGLTVLREVRVLMPDQVFLFISDDEGFPYGAWNEAELRERILRLFTGFIARHRPLLVIIACNTASTLVLGDLREAFPDTPFVGTVPAIKPAAERTSSGHVSVLATPGTVKRAYTHGLIDSFATSCHVRLVGSTHLAAMAEAHIRGEELDEESVLHEIGPCFVEEDGKRTDIVVLACTHYPFLANVFRRLSPWPVDWLDPAEAIARRVLSLLQKQKAGEGNATGAFGQDIALFTSGQADFSTRRLMSGFGLQSQASLESATEPDA